MTSGDPAVVAHGFEMVRHQIEVVREAVGDSAAYLTNLGRMVGVLQEEVDRPPHRLRKGAMNTTLSDCAAASACLLYNALPDILQCDPPEAYRRLVQHLETTILSYLDASNNWGFTPSDN